MKPFLLLATRAEDRAADEEYDAFLRFGGLTPDRLVRVRLEEAALPPLDLDDYAGLILGGSPFTTSDPDEAKSPVQRRVERELDVLLTEVVARDFPLLGACYGIGTLGLNQGAIVDGTYAEDVGAVVVEITDAGRTDPLFSALPTTFEAFVGHKEAITELPPHAVLLAGSQPCPVQAFRVGRNVYATQFHPELDVPGIHGRIEVYKHYGYFHPDTAEHLKQMASNSDVRFPPLLVRRFVELFG